MHKSIKHIQLIIIILLVTVKSLTAQNERISVFLDRDCYVSGEMMWFNIIVIDNSIHNFSKNSMIAYSEVINPHGLVVVRKKFRLKDGIAAGDFLLPDTLSSAHYNVIAYTHSMRNHPDKIFNKEIYIYNPEKNNTIAPVFNSESKQEMIQKDSSNVNTQIKRIQINGLKKSYTTRETGQFTVSNPYQEDINFSVSIRKAYENADSNNFISGLSECLSDQNYDEQIESEPNHDKYYHSENQGVILSGKLTGSFSDQNINRIFLGYPDDKTHIKAFDLAEDNSFMFYVYPDEPKKDIILRTNRKNREITRGYTLNNPYLNDYKNFIPTSAKKPDSTLREFLKEIYINKRIQDVYYQNQYVEDDSVFNNPNWINYSFYGKPDNVYHFENYVALDSMQEFFHEIVTNVQISKSNNNRVFHVMNKNTLKVFEGTPVIFLDGIMIDDAETILEIDPSLCSKVEVVESPVLILDSTFYGVVSLYTKNSDLDGIELPEHFTRIEYELYDPPKKIFIPDELEPNIPYYRNTLFWKPSLKLKQDEIENIKFITGDSKGLYEVMVKGIDKQGAIYKSVQYFSVQ